MDLILIKLARFITSREQDRLGKDIKEILKLKVDSITIFPDNWGRKRRIFFKIETDPKNLEMIFRILLSYPGITSIIHFDTDLFNWESTSLKELVNEIVTYVRSHNTDLLYNIDFRVVNDVPLHKKAITDRLLKKGLVFNTQSKFTLYLELKSTDKKIDNSKSTLYARIGRKYSYPKHDNKVDQKIIPNLVLYSPFTTQEMSDFFRLGLIFNTSIIITNENKKAGFLIEEVKKSYFKGISKVKFKIVPSLKELVEEIKESHFFGFSLWGKKSINELPKMIKDTNLQSNSLNHQIFFLFGNEEYGLPLFIRHQIPIFRIGHSSEPLRASQAAAYTLGIVSKI